MPRISEEIIKSQSEYMCLFGSDPESFAAGVRWADNFLDAILKAELQATMKSIFANAKISTEIVKQDLCKHTRVEEIQGGQIERCLDCGKTWG